MTGIFPNPLHQFKVGIVLIVHHSKCEIGWVLQFIVKMEQGVIIHNLKRMLYFPPLDSN